MSGIIKSTLGRIQQMGRDVGNITGIHAEGLLGYKPPKAPEPTPGPPTADLAARAADDRVKARRGALANIFGGATASATPNVGKATLGGS